ncbi:Ref family recombination enhancement nuclease [Silvimonas soli]|uniref:Ref family recombination enhancement nuclease n=1 Tax=Silvimonas soli TaxID=2980100 RepID=UPI0024B3360D|nr:Ref family recombination enhancement nuclease [Silvimonas soli]
MMSTARPSKTVPRPGDVPPAVMRHTAASIEKSHKTRVAALGCILCHELAQHQNGDTYLHHVRSDQGLSQRASDFLVIPLCHEHHQGASGIHGLGTRMFYTRYQLTELDLLAMVIGRLEGEL